MRLVLVTRQGCHLCDEALAAIDDVIRDRRLAGLLVPQLRLVDIAGDAALEHLYGERIPVVTLDGEELELVIGVRRLARLMERVLDGVAAS